MFRFLKPLVYAVIATVAGSFAYKEGKQALFPAPASEQTIDTKPVENWGQSREEWTTRRKAEGRA